MDFADLAGERDGSVSSQGPESSAAGDVEATDTDSDTDHDEGEKTTCTVGAACCLEVDCGEGVARFEESVVVVDRVHESDEVGESSNEADDHLTGDGEWNVPLRIWDFLCEMAGFLSVFDTLN